jgi:hypothetical protein
MDELIHEFSRLLEAGDGTLYVVRVYGAPRGGVWDGWLTFFAAGRASLETGRETTQSSRTALEYWASGLEPVYLEGALDRARRRRQSPPVKPAA